VSSHGGLAPSTSCTTVLSFFCDLFLFYPPHSPDFFIMFFSCLWHTSVLSVPHTCHSLSIYYLDHAPNIHYYQMLILLFSFRLTSSPQSIHHHPHSVNSRGLPLANRPLHSIAHITDSLASQLLQHLCLRGVPPLLATQTVPRQIRRPTSPLHHHTAAIASLSSGPFLESTTPLPPNVSSAGSLL
jgi:hypothetical protein